MGRRAHILQVPLVLVMVKHLTDDFRSVCDPAVEDRALSVLLHESFLHMSWVVVQRHFLLSQRRKHVMDEELLLLFVPLNHLRVHEKVEFNLLLAFFSIGGYVVRVVRDAVGVQTRLAPGHMDIHRVRWVNFETLRRELVSIGDHGLFESHHLHQDGLPVLDIVSRLTSGNQIFLVLIQLANFGIWANFPTLNAQLEEIRLVHIIIHAKWQNFLHPFIPPFIERGSD